MDECKPLLGGGHGELVDDTGGAAGAGCDVSVRGGGQELPAGGDAEDHLGRGLHSSTLQLNLSALHGIGGARRGYEARVVGCCGVLWGVVGCLWCVGCFLCQTRLKLS